MSFEENFIYPLIILLAGSGLSLFLVPRFTGKYQEKQRELEIIRENRHKELEIKSKLISKISELTGKATAYTHAISNDENFKISGERYAEWSANLLTTAALMDAYFHNSELFKKWDMLKAGLSSFVYTFYVISEMKKDPNIENFEMLKEFINDDKIEWGKLKPGKEYGKEWTDIRSVILKVSNSLILEINSTPIKIL